MSTSCILLLKEKNNLSPKRICLSHCATMASRPPPLPPSHYFIFMGAKLLCLLSFGTFSSRICTPLPRRLMQVSMKPESTLAQDARDAKQSRKATRRPLGALLGARFHVWPRDLEACAARANPSRLFVPTTLARLHLTCPPYLEFIRQFWNQPARHAHPVVVVILVLC